MWLHREAGFTITEVMIAVMILTVGLLGVAAMQLKAINDNYRATVLTEKTGVAEQWMEWLINFSRQNYHADSDAYIGYDCLAALDTQPQAGYFTAVPIAGMNPQELSETLHDLGLRPPTSEFFTEAQLPKFQTKKYCITLYIDAQTPVENTTTIKIEAAEGQNSSSLIFVISRTI